MGISTAHFPSPLVAYVLACHVLMPKAAFLAVQPQGVNSGGLTTTGAPAQPGAGQTLVIHMQDYLFVWPQFPTIDIPGLICPQSSLQGLSPLQSLS